MFARMAAYAYMSASHSAGGKFIDEHIRALASTAQTHEQSRLPHHMRSGKDHDEDMPRIVRQSSVNGDVGKDPEAKPAFGHRKKERKDAPACNGIPASCGEDGKRMNDHRISLAASKIGRARAALKWLEDCGVKSPAEIGSKPRRLSIFTLKRAAARKRRRILNSYAPVCRRLFIRDPVLRNDIDIAVRAIS